MRKNPAKTVERLLLSAVFLIPFYFVRFTIGAVPTNIFEIVVILTGLYVILESTLLRSDPLPPLRLPSWPVAAFLIIAAGSVAIAGDKIGALGIFKGWFLVPIVFYWLAGNFLDRKTISGASAVLFASTLVISLWALLQRLGVIGLLFYQKSDPESFARYLEYPVRAFGPFESPNYLAMFLVPAMFLSLPVFSLIPGKTKGVTTILYLLPLIALYFSGSRGGLLAFGVSLGVPLIITLEKRVSSRYKNITKLSYLLPLIIILAAANYYFRDPSQSSDEIRLEIYRYAANMLQGHYLWGIGLGGFFSMIDAMVPNPSVFREFGLPYALHPHNLYLALWLNLGAAGLVVFGLLIGDFFKKISRLNFLLKISAAPALLAIMVHGLVDTTYFKNDLSALFWLALAFPYLKQKQNEKLPV